MAELKLTPETVCAGDDVKYARPSSTGYLGHVHTQVIYVGSPGNFPVIGLNNGHTARWDGGKYVLEDMAYTTLEYSNRVFACQGMLWNDGDVPRCSYCKENYDNVVSLHETPLSGGLVCDDRDCRDKLLTNILTEKVREEI